MTPDFALGLLGSFALLLVGLRVGLGLLERYVPGASEWLDRNVGTPQGWE